MSSVQFVEWTGKSGMVHKYWLIDIGSPLKDEGGNYGFARRLPNGNVTPLYFGEADSLRNRLTKHERWGEALRLGVTHLMAHTTPGGEQARMAEERDLVRYWNPPMNIQQRSKATFYRQDS